MSPMVNRVAGSERGTLRARREGRLKLPFSWCGQAVTVL